MPSNELKTSKAAELLSSLGDSLFCLILFLLACILYSNTLDGGYVWDDRAAIVNNPDVVDIKNTSLKDLLSHDFWGQPIHLPESHKSFRPITVLTFRANFVLHGLVAWGYHAGNVIIFAITVVFMYVFSRQWMNSLTGARTAAILFLVHPIHVEAVASLVGRADSLCGLFYLASLIFYSKSLEYTSGYPAKLLQHETSNHSHNSQKLQKQSKSHKETLTNTFHGWTLFFTSLVVAMAACFSKELGVTIFGSFVILEFAYNINLFKSLKSSNKKQPSATHSPTIQPISLLYQSVIYTLTNFESAFRIVTHILLVLALTFFRIQLNGAESLYKWTILENHINLLPTFTDRALSYGQSHFWYFLKIIFPRYLCFDYGYACIPTVHDIYDPRNLLPLGTYFLVLYLVYFGIIHSRVTVLVGLTILILPLVPALNIFFPVGTILAERLLFIPSVGACIIIADFISEDLLDVWLFLSEKITRIMAKRGKQVNSVRAANSSSFSFYFFHPSSQSLHESVKFTRSKNSILVVLFPISLLCIARVVTRNRDWNSEIQIYKSALDVCPHSVKALANFASLSLGEGDYDKAVGATELAVNLHNGLDSGWINGGIAYQRKGKLIRSLRWLAEARRISPLNEKAVGYLGSALYDFANSLEKDSPFLQQLHQEAAQTLDQAIAMGFDPPSILHSRGSLAMDMNDHDSAILYFSFALKKAEERKLIASDVPQQDGIHEPLTLNQLGNALSKLGRTQEAIDAYEKGMQFSPPLLALHSNLGNLYRFNGQVDKARAVFEHGISAANEDKSPLGAALFNNLGLLELEAGKPDIALFHFRKAMNMIESLTATGNSIDGEVARGGTSGTAKAKMMTFSGQSIYDVFKINIERAEAEMRNREL